MNYVRSHDKRKMRTGGRVNAKVRPLCPHTPPHGVLKDFERS